MIKWDFQIHTYITIKVALFLSPFAVLHAYVYVAGGKKRENNIYTSFY